jgi:glutaredoxin
VEETPGWLREALAGARVVIFRSRLTDVRPLQVWLTAHPDLAVREVLMEMGSGEQRDRFQALKHHTGWGTLPQVFVDGQFVGGQVEFFGHTVVSGPEASGATRDVPDMAVPSPALIQALGYAGLLPFAAGVLLLLIPGLPVPEGFGAGWLLAYGAVIATFLGAVHWGAALAGRYGGGEAGRAAVWAVIPSILAWITLLLPVTWALPCQVLLFGLILGVDWRYGAHLVWPGYYRRLRIILSTTVMILLGIAWLALMAHHF